MQNALTLLTIFLVTTAHAASERVAPGFVNWHSDLATAQKKSAASQKPVLLFQLLGDLDTRYS